MFGNRKKEQEQVREEVSLIQESMRNDMLELQESVARMETDVQQVAKNVTVSAEYAKLNEEKAFSLAHSLEQHQEDLKETERIYATIREQMQRLENNTEQLVEQNKHFTAPSKYLSNLPDLLREENEHYLGELDTMQGYSKQMAVLALNAAIEAGRMGESGKGFVNAAEEIRTFAKSYESSFDSMRNDVQQSQERIKELEETIHHLVNLLKDNNVSTTKLLKTCHNTSQQMETITSQTNSHAIAPIKEVVGEILGTEEELFKCAERNRMQLEDVSDELSAMQTTIQNACHS